MDLLAHGAAYADQCIRNAQALGRALAAEGLPVHGVEGRGHTESHHLAMQSARFGGGQTAAKKLAAANILLCGIGLPIAPVAGDLNGIRLGSQELTRFGLKEEAMAEVARFIARFLVKGEAADSIRRDVIAFRRDYQQIHYVR
jgi:glycine hydroxymethyltransferase